VGVRVGVAYSLYKLKIKIRNHNSLSLKVSEISAFLSTIYKVCRRFEGVKVGVEIF